MENQSDYSNIITPPDFVNEPKHTVLVIDADAGHIQAIGAFLKILTITLTFTCITVTWAIKNGLHKLEIVLMHL